MKGCVGVPGSALQLNTNTRETHNPPRRQPQTSPCRADHIRGRGLQRQKLRRALITRGSHLHRDSELNSPRSRDETSRASPAVIQAGARRAARGRIGYSESALSSYYYNNDYAAVAALAGASFENVANMTRFQCDLYIPRPSLEEESVVYRN